jgi:hypothetical protein
MIGGNMKTMKMLLVAGLTMGITACLTMGQQALADGPPMGRDVVIGISDAYIPGGFDSTADAYTVVSGLFPNSCYKWKTANVNHVDSFHHHVQSVATVTPGMCMMVMIPFTKNVDLGKLQSGTHTIRFLNGDGSYLEKTTQVE